MTRSTCVWVSVCLAWRDLVNHLEIAVRATFVFILCAFRLVYDIYTSVQMIYILCNGERRGLKEPEEVEVFTIQTLFSPSPPLTPGIHTHLCRWETQHGK